MSGKSYDEKFDNVNYESVRSEISTAFHSCGHAFEYAALARPLSCETSINEAIRALKRAKDLLNEV